MNQHYFDVPFAFSGDKTTIPDPLQTGGSVSMTEGWNYNYQRNLSTDPAALPIDRSTMNWLLNAITVALQALQQTAIPEWIKAVDNGGTSFPYIKGAEVLYSSTGTAPFTKYVSLIANNTDTPGATGNWQVVVDAIATSAQAAAGTDNTTIMTPALVAQQDALRALLAGNSAQVFNVAPATAPSHAARMSQVVGVIGTSRNVKMNITSAAASGTVTGDEIVVIDGTTGFPYKLISYSQVVNLATTGAGGMDTGSAPNNGFVALYAIYNPTGNTRSILAQNAPGIVGEQYGGANMPAGYTASALIGIIPTNGSRQFIVCSLSERRVYFAATSALNTSTQQASLTAFGISTVVPANAKTTRGYAVIVSNTNANLFANISGSAAGIGGAQMSISTNVAGAGISAPFADIPIATAQTLYYTGTASAGTMTFGVSLSGYTF